RDTRDASTLPSALLESKRIHVAIRYQLRNSPVLPSGRIGGPRMKKVPDALHRSTVARHATLPSPTRTSTGLKLLGAALAAVLVAAIGVGAFIAIDLATRATADSVGLEGAPEIAPPALGEYPG